MKWPSAPGVDGSKVYLEWRGRRKEGEREKVGLIWWWIREQCLKLALHLPSPFYAFSLTFLPFLFSHSLPLLPPPPILLVPSLSLTLVSLSCILRVTTAAEGSRQPLAALYGTRLLVFFLNSRPCLRSWTWKVFTLNPRESNSQSQVIHF